MIKIGIPMDSSTQEIPVTQIMTNSKCTMEEPPMGVVNDKEIESMEGIDAGEIESICVIKGESATALYGEEGRNGVIILNTK